VASSDFFDGEERSKEPGSKEMFAGRSSGVVEDTWKIRERRGCVSRTRRANQPRREREWNEETNRRARVLLSSLQNACTREIPRRRFEGSCLGEGGQRREHLAVLPTRRDLRRKEER